MKLRQCDHTNGPVPTRIPGLFAVGGGDGGIWSGCNQGNTDNQENKPCIVWDSPNTVHTCASGIDINDDMHEECTLFIRNTI